MTSSRAKGLSYCREVKKILEGIDHVVEGPGYKPLWTGKGMSAVHSDYFGVFDLISFDGKEFLFHQVSDIGHKSDKIKSIQEKKMNGWVWCRVPSRPISYRIFFVVGDHTEEGSVMFKGGLNG